MWTNPVANQGISTNKLPTPSTDSSRLDFSSEINGITEGVFEQWLCNHFKSNSCFPGSPQIKEDNNSKKNKKKNSNNNNNNNNYNNNKK